MRKDIKLPALVASDIGGTLISGDVPLGDFTLRVLNRLVDTGVPTALITGYNYRSAVAVTGGLDPRVLLLPQNGALCVEGDRVVWEYRIPGARARTVYDYLAANGLPLIVYKGKDAGFSNFYINPVEIPDLAFAFQRVGHLEDFEDITGVSTLLPDDRAREVRGELGRILGSDFKIIYTPEARGSWLEAVHTGVRKDLALKRLCGRFSVPLAETVYFGDNYNDLEVLGTVGMPILVENAAAALKEQFPTVIPSVHCEGVAHYLNDLYGLYPGG